MRQPFILQINYNVGRPVKNTGSARRKISETHSAERLENVNITGAPVIPTIQIIVEHEAAPLRRSKAIFCHYAMIRLYWKDATEDREDPL